MNCHLLRSQLIEFARGRLPHVRDALDQDRVMAHLNICQSCSLLMEEQLGLTAAFEEFAARSDMAPPANLESIVLSEFDANKKLPGRHWKGAVAAILAIAAALVSEYGGRMCRKSWYTKASEVEIKSAVSPQKVSE